MLEKIRKHSQNMFLWAALGVIVFVFVFFFGPQTQGFSPGSRKWAVRVEGHTIFDAQITARFLMTRDRGQRASDIEFAELRRSVARDMALVYVLSDRARAAGLGVTDNELKCYIVNWHRNYRIDGELACREFPDDYAERYRNLDFVQYSDEDGRLSENYRTAVRGAFQMAIDEYEDFKRDELLALRYLDLLASSLPVSPESVASTYERRNESVDLEYVRIDPIVARGPEVSDAEVAAFVATDASTLAEYYNANVQSFSEDRQVRFRSVFVRRPDAAAAEYAAAEAKYNDLLARAQAGEDFNTLVTENTEAANERDTIGDMGLRPVANLSEQLVSALDGLSVGGIAGAEFTTFWRILKLEEDLPARQRPLEEVQIDIARTLLTERATEDARSSIRSRGERILALVQANNDVSAALALESVEYAAASGAAMAAPAPGDLSGDVLPEAPSSPFRAESTGLFARERAGELLGEGANAFRLPAPPPDQVPGIGTAPEIARVAFQLTSEAPVHPTLVEVDGAFYVVRLKERNAPATPVPDTDARAIELELRNELAETLVARDATRARMFVHSAAASYGPVAQQILDEALATGGIRFNESVFAVDPTAELAR